MCTSYESAIPTDVPRLVGRRGFLRGGAAAALGLAAAGLLRGTPAAAAEEAGGALTGGAAAGSAAGGGEADPTEGEAEGGRVPLDRASIQLYSLRSLLADDLDGVLTGLAEIGYPHVEHAGFHGRDAATFRERLDAAGLSATSGHQSLPWPFDELRWRRIVDAAYTVGQRSIVEPLPMFALPGMAIPELARLSPSIIWGRFATDLNRAAEIAKVYGIDVGYHNHDVEFRPLALGLGARTAYDILLAETDPDLVHFELDLYWAWKAEVDPVELLAAHPTRFRKLHVKDMDADGGITFPGTGMIDFARIFAAAEEHGVEVDDFIIEQDNAGSRGMECAQLGFDLLRDTRW
jgi:sugar phosphate isomerase/epimerase